MPKWTTIIIILAFVTFFAFSCFEFSRMIIHFFPTMRKNAGFIIGTSPIFINQNFLEFFPIRTWLGFIVNISSAPILRIVIVDALLTIMIFNIRTTDSFIDIYIKLFWFNIVMNQRNSNFRFWMAKRTKFCIWTLF